MKRPATWLSYLAVAGNVVYILWIVYNAIDDGFRTAGTRPLEAVVLSGLLVLLALNATLLVLSVRARN